MDADIQLWQLRDNASDKSLVNDGILVTRTWSQKWQTAGGRRPNLRRDSEAGNSPINE